MGRSQRTGQEAQALSGLQEGYEVVISQCFLCGIDLEPGLVESTQVHPEIDTCLVRFTDGLGIAIDAPIFEEARPDEGRPGFFEEMNIQLFPTVEEVLIEIFTAHGLPRLGGASTGRGWSAFSTFQQCKYLYYRKYIDPIDSGVIIPGIEPEARAIGMVIHAMLAVYYSKMIIPEYPLTPGLLRDQMLKRAKPEFVEEGYRVFNAYALYYQDEDIMPLAVEYDLRDPRNNESCRFDLIAFFRTAQSDRMPGTYNLEHKSSQRFDDTTLNGWANDGEILGQMMLWERMKLDLRFGKLRGTIVNLLGKQKEPKFHRTTVAPETWQTKQHKADLKQHEADMHMARVTGVFPRSRANCIHRFGKCFLYDHCASVEE